MFATMTLMFIRTMAPASVKSVPYIFNEKEIDFL
jgi:hypothetical protein